MVDYSDIVSLSELPCMQLLGIIHNKLQFENGTETRVFDGNATVLIPCYMKSNYIEETVLSCVKSTMRVNVLVLLMDPESQSKKNILESYDNVKCIISDRMNVCKARTYLVDRCETDWFIFLDADDLLSSDYLEVLSKCDGAIRVSNCMLEEEEEPFLPFEEYLQNLLVLNNTCLMHKDVFYDIGYDEEQYQGAEDTDFYLRLLNKQKWKISLNPDTYFVYRRNSENQLTKNWKPFENSVMRYLRKNKDIIINHLQIEQTKRVLELLLEHINVTNICSFLKILTKTPFNKKRLLDRTVSELYDSLISGPKTNTHRIIKLKHGRVFSVEDVIKKYESLPEDIKKRTSNIHPIDAFFSIIRDYPCVEVDVFSSSETQVPNNQFEEWSNICNTSELLGVFTKVLIKVTTG